MRGDCWPEGRCWGMGGPGVARIYPWTLMESHRHQHFRLSDTATDIQLTAPPKTEFFNTVTPCYVRQSRLNPLDGTDRLSLGVLVNTGDFQRTNRAYEICRLAHCDDVLTEDHREEHYCKNREMLPRGVAERSLNSSPRTYSDSDGVPARKEDYQVLLRRKSDKTRHGSAIDRSIEGELI